MSPVQETPSASLIPLYLNAVIAGSIGATFLFGGSESALLLLFMLGLIYVCGLMFGVCTLIMARTAVTTRDPMLAAAVAASASYMAIWIFAATSGEISHNSGVYLSAFLSSFVYAAIVLVLAARVQRRPRRSSNAETS